MKKKYLMTLMAILLVLLLAACGSSSDTSTPSQDETTDRQETQATEEVTEEATEAATEPAVNPYAWLGLQDMPECNYLDIIASNHYILVTDEYIDGMSYVDEKTKAVDGINSYEEDKDSITVNLEGMITSINKDSKTYMEQDMTNLIDYSKNALASSMENGEDTTGRSFNGTGSGTIPVYGEQSGDKNKYDYYEYHYPDNETSGDTYMERFYMKDGDVFAIYNYYDWSGTEIKSTTVIKSISGDIPADIFDVNLSGYKKAE